MIKLTEPPGATAVRTPAKDVKIVGVDIEFWPLTQLLVKLIYAGLLATVIVLVEVSLVWLIAVVFFGHKAINLTIAILSIFS